MSIRRKETEREGYAKTLNHNKMSARNLISTKKQQEQLMEEDSTRSNVIRFVQNICNSISKSKFPTYICIIFYITICVLGNIVTGIMVFKHLGKESPSWVSLFQTELTEYEDSIGSELDYDAQFAEQNDLALQLLYSNETKNTVSHVKHCSFFFRT